MAFAEAQAPAPESADQEQLASLLQKHCFECHSGENAEGGISLDRGSSLARIREHRQTWQRALGQVRFGVMPPSDTKPLTSRDRSQLTRLISEAINSADCTAPTNPGRVTLRRLNRAEYHNTIRDLWNIDYQPTTQFPGDDVGYGFDNIGDVLSLPPLLMEKYLQAAETIAAKAIRLPGEPAPFEANQAATQLIGADQFHRANGFLALWSNGSVRLRAEVPQSGKFLLTIRAGGDQAGDQPVRFDVRLQGKTVTTLEAPKTTPTTHKVPLHLDAGLQEIEFAFINDLYIPRRNLDRNLHLYHVRLQSEQPMVQPISEADLPASHRQILFVRPSEGVSEKEASRKIIRRLCGRAFRRPASASQLARFEELASNVREAGGSFEESIQTVLRAVLTSPYFLFKVESPPPANGKKRAYWIKPHELATRISYFLWSSMPDDELMLLAHQGRLRDPQILRSQMKRMLADSRINAFVENFAGQWLQLRNLDTMTPDPNRFPEFNPSIAEAMKQETLGLFAEVVRENLPVATLLDAPFTYLNESLAKYYGISGVRGSHYRRVLLQGTVRRGLLTHGSILTLTSNPTRTSPVKRGKWILDNLLNMPPPPAPPNTPELERKSLSGTLRERLQQHRGDPACASCHQRMDPLGLAMENFDAVGQWRTTVQGQAIDAKGKLPEGQTFQGLDGLLEVLTDKYHQRFVTSLTEKLMTYAIGRGLEHYDRCAIQKIVKASASQDYRFTDLLVGILESAPFQQQGKHK